ncbi:MAG: zinc-binding dehydrogenase [Candidatus Marinimicrobia bacterium]|nr:zinc-binding dehydrogenase [Candidatus Neomarinimicrobiota bacterium]MCF7839544.1 zinc-binding dehydrogenase [Candidatus Neomarinimicrobiota bacterium]MCF7901911.1 zinc-binding dehydrogenase [Candidatus Neomarinimicrobiota bacterium]
MQALQYHKFGGPDVLKLENLPDPEVTRDTVLVRMKATALNHLDIWVRNGIPGLPIIMPHVPGSDGAGVVEAVGRNVSGWKAGDEVVIQPGTFCGHCEACQRGQEDLCPEYGILGETSPGVMQTLKNYDPVNLGRKPANLTWEESAALPLVYLTAWNMLINRAELKAGETVLVQGASSGVGMAAIQIAKHVGATVIATARTAVKRTAAGLLGAHYTLNSAEPKMYKEVKSLTRGKGVDVVVEHVGQATWQNSLRSLGFAGRLVTCGATTGPVAEVEIRHIFSKRLSILGSTMGSVADFNAVLFLAEKGVLKPWIDRVFPLDKGQAAHTYLVSEHGFGKVVISME